jgi:NAD-dependent deacetylase
VRIYILEILMRIKISAIHIVWFGEEVPALELAIEVTEIADYFVVIGTSSLSGGRFDGFYKRYNIYILYDPKPVKIPNLRILCM